MAPPTSATVSSSTSDSGNATHMSAYPSSRRDLDTPSAWYWNNSPDLTLTAHAVQQPMRHA